jgi:dihydroneopterin aldolase
MMQVHLKEVRFYAYHGLDEGEDVLGGEYEVSLSASYMPKEIPVLSITETIDYAILYNLVKQRMRRPAKLLETLVTEIASEIFAKFSNVENVVISIHKLQPPIQNFEGAVGVTFQLKRE